VLYEKQEKVRICRKFGLTASLIWRKCTFVLSFLWTLFCYTRETRLYFRNYWIQQNFFLYSKPIFCQQAAANWNSDKSIKSHLWSNWKHFFFSFLFGSG